MFPVGDIIRLNALSRPEALAIQFDENPMSYKEFDGYINRVAHSFLKIGVVKGDRVAVLDKSSLEYIAIYFALAKIGAILVPLSYWYRAPELLYVLQNSEPKALLVGEGYHDLVQSIRGDLSTIENYISIKEGGLDNALNWQEFLVGEGERNEPGVNIDLNDPHMILYTSGTTGKPKGAILSHRRTVADAHGNALVLGVTPQDKFINFFPPFHVGMWDHMKLFLLVGAGVVCLREFDAGKVLNTIEREKITYLLCVPTMLRMLLEDPDFSKTDLSSLKTLYYGAYDPTGIMDKAAQLLGAKEGKIKMVHTYGLTEGGPFVTACHSHEIFRKWGSVGRPIVGVEVKLVDDNDNEVPQGEAGEIIVHGPIMSGYWRLPEASVDTLRGGWLHTGDVAIKDEDGFYYIVDRKKDMIRSGGQNIYSKQIEDCLLGHPKVKDVAIIGLPDEIYEERVAAIIQIREGESLEAEEVKAYVKGIMAGYNTPKVVEFVDELPKNAVGKTMKNVLRAQYGGTFQSRRTKV